MYYDPVYIDSTSADTTLVGTIVASGRTVIIIGDEGTGYGMCPFCTDTYCSGCYSYAYSNYSELLKWAAELPVESEVIHEDPGFVILYVLAFYVVFLHRINARRLPDHFL